MMSDLFALAGKVALVTGHVLCIGGAMSATLMPEDPGAV